MGGNTTLLEIFLALYALECIEWVPKGGLVAIRRAWGSWRILGSGLRLKSVLPAGAAFPLQPRQDWDLLAPEPDDLEEVRRRVAAHSKAARFFNAAGALLLSCVGGMLLLWNQGPGAGRAEAFAVLMAAAILTHIVIIWRLTKAWKAVLGSTVGRGNSLALAALSPWASSRASDLLGRRLLTDLHPAAVAAVLLDPVACRHFLFRCARHSMHPLPGQSPDSGSWKRLVTSLGEDPDAVLAPPIQQDQQAKTYCPRCLVQYVSEQENCADCNLALLPFKRN